MYGIYTAVCQGNGKIYIGQTNDYQRRLIEHKSKLKTKKHCNRKFQFIHDKYGWDSFEWSFKECGENISKEALDNLEQFYIDSFDKDDLINLDLHVKYPNRGREKSPEYLAALSARMTGKNNPNYGIKWSEERRRKHSEQRKGKPFNLTPEARKKRSERVKGDNNPTKRLEVKRKMQEAKLKFTLEQCFEIYKLKEEGMGPTAIGRIFNCDRKALRSPIKYLERFHLDAYKEWKDNKTI